MRHLPYDYARCSNTTCHSGIDASGIFLQGGQGISSMLSFREGRTVMGLSRSQPLRKMGLLLIDPVTKIRYLCSSPIRGRSRDGIGAVRRLGFPCWRSSMKMIKTLRIAATLVMARTFGRYVSSGRQRVVRAADALRSCFLSQRLT